MRVPYLLKEQQRPQYGAHADEFVPVPHDDAHPRRPAAAPLVVHRLEVPVREAVLTAPQDTEGILHAVFIVLRLEQLQLFVLLHHAEAGQLEEASDKVPLFAGQRFFLKTLEAALSLFEKSSLLLFVYAGHASYVVFIAAQRKFPISLER